MKKVTLLITIVLSALVASQAQGIYNNGARIVSTSESCWVLDNGSFALTSASSTNLVQFANLVIENDASLTLGTDATPAYLTVSGSLANGSGNSGLVLKSRSSLIEGSGSAATVESAIPASQWHLISAPISDATSNMFYGKYLQLHTESSNAYTDITPTTGNLIPMKGFALWGDAAGFTATYAGPLNAGAESFTTTYSGAGKGWNLVGNPYPSSIDWDAASGWTKTGVNAATYCHVEYNTEAPYYGWATFVNSIGANGGNRYIAHGQGFFVQAASNGTLAMTNDVRVHNATVFFKSSEEVIPNLVRLQVSGNGYTDEAVVRFLPEATATFDGDFDAHKLFGDMAEAAQIYTTGSTPLSINSLPETDFVPVGVKAGVDGIYTIAATEVNDLQYATLEDTKTGILTALSNNTYTFSIDKDENEMRFKLHFSMLGVADNKDVAANIYSYRKTAYINLKSQVEGDIFVYNIAGQQVAKRLSAKGMNEIGLNNTGNYIVKVVTDKSSQVKKIFIQ